MQTRKILFGAAAVSLAITGFSVPAFAAKDGKPDGNRAQRMIERLDTDKDGKISLDEFKIQASTAFKAFDADGNGEVSKDEIKAKREAFREARKAWRDAKADSEKAEARDAMKAAGPGMLHGAGRMFERADTDKNGTLNEAEATAASETMFKRRDKNSDGFIETAEFSGMGGKGAGRHAGRMLERLDLNKDKKVSPEELLQRASMTFLRFDADSNGEVGKDEIKAQRETFREARKLRHEARAEAGGKDGMKRRHGMRQGGGMFPMGEKMFDQADADKNGSLSKTELASAVDAMFKRRDSNGDGFIDAADRDVKKQ